MAREYEILIADSEFYNPSENPRFWYGAYLDLATGEYQSMANFGIFWNKLFVEIPKDRQRVVVFHNGHNYDMPNLMIEAVSKLGYKFNPIKQIKDKHGKVIKEFSEKGKKKAIYQGQTWEVYGKENEKGVIVIDSLPLLRASIAELGERFGMPKGETPIVQEWSMPTKEQEEYLKRDIMILAKAYEEYDLEQAITHGQYTISSVAKADFKYRHRTIKGSKQHTGSMKHAFAVSNRKQESNSMLPKQLKVTLDEIEKQATEYLESYFSEDGEPTMKAPQFLVSKYIDSKTKEGLKQYRHEVKGFTKLKKSATRHDYNFDNRKEYLALTIPLELDFEQEEFQREIDEWMFLTILKANNGSIRKGFRGGIVHLNPKHYDEILGKGFVIDAVSMYPSVMMKYEIPTEFVCTTETLDPNLNFYYVAEITNLKAVLKEGKHPCLKRNQEYFPRDLKYADFLNWNAEKEKHTSMLNSVDMEMLYENYDVLELEIKKVHYYKADKEFNQAVREFIQYWFEQKEKAQKGSPDYIRAKNMLNNLWGSWAMYEKKVLQGGIEIDVGHKDTNLISALFVTSYGRLELNNAMNYFGEQLIYSNTDSVHVLLKNGESVESTLEKVSAKIGYTLNTWNLETVFERAKYLGNNKYCHELENKKLHTVIAGAKFESERISSLEDFFKGKLLETLDSHVNERGQVVITKSMFKL